jgi:cysteine desulfurase
VRGIFLDNNATTHLTPAVKDAVHAFVDEDPGNPESPHSDGSKALALVSDCRFSVASALNAQDDQIIFTGSGSESNTYAVAAAAARAGSSERLKVLTSDLEHSSIAAALTNLERKGAEVVKCPVTRDGIVDIRRLETLLKEGFDAIFVQWANNETGAIQPIEEIGGLARHTRTYFHVDAAQAFGRIPIDVEAAQCDSLTITAHKIHGPKGIAALFAESVSKLPVVVFGGQQERGVRGGTHNTIGICGLWSALQERFSDFEGATEKLRSLRDQLEGRVQELVPAATVQSAGVARVPNTTCITFPNADGMQMVGRLDAHGVQCSQTSACRSRRPEPSAVLTAMGLSEELAYGTLRFAVSVMNTEEEIERAAILIGRAFSEVTNV